MAVRDGRARAAAVPDDLAPGAGAGARAAIGAGAGSAGNRQDEQEKILKFRTHVEPPEPMRGLEVPSEVVAALGEGARPR